MFLPRSFMSSILCALASSMVMAGSETVAAAAAASSSRVAFLQSPLCGGTLAEEMMRRCGSTRKRARILRCPGLDGSAKEKGMTRCCSVLGKVIRRPSVVATLPRSCVINPPA